MDRLVMEIRINLAGPEETNPTRPQLSRDLCVQLLGHIAVMTQTGILLTALGYVMSNFYIQKNNKMRFIFLFYTMARANARFWLAGEVLINFR